MTRARPLACRFALAGLALVGCGGRMTGGTEGISAGGAETGGRVIGGTEAITEGGRTTGGAASGGYMTGGTATGGTATGGRATGGRATGGTGAVAVCQTVTTLPLQYSQCGGASGESRCLPNGDRCVCALGAWYCDNACPAIPPPPNGDCSSNRGAACTYANGGACLCVNNRWMCLGTSSECPAPGITTGDDCTGRIGLACDYPGATHLACVCAPETDASPIWTCVVSGSCPATQPVYPSACTSTRLCAYGNVQCVCLNGGAWICLPP